MWKECYFTPATLPSTQLQLEIRLVEWNQDVSPKEIKSAQDILAGQQNGSLTVKKTDVIVNHPVIKWE